MKTAGIICEYNPFHNGHKYHIEQTKKQLNVDAVICVMSGNVVQRGETAVFPMHFRAETAIKNGADLVLEIPPRFVLQSAQFYACNAVYILNSLGITDYLSFGSESGDIESIKKAISDTKNFREKIDTGMGYAKAICENEILQTPNNILAAEYLKALKALNSDIKPFTLKRNSVAHDSKEQKNGFASASYIRSLIKDGGNWQEYVPDFEKSDITLYKSQEDLWELIAYKLKLGKADDFENILNISEGLNNRILKYKDCKTFSECVDSVSCKRYPKSRIRRALMCILLDFEKSDTLPTYTRVLASNETGNKLLKSIKKTATIPVLSRITKKDIYNIPFLKEELITEDIIKPMNS